MRRVLRSILDAAALLQLPREQRRVVFYSEGTAYWAHLEKLLASFLELDAASVCYLSSQHDDPGLRYRHDRLRTFRTDAGWVRNWLFENIDCELMVLTMPDLDQYQVRRSRHPVHYVYVQHSLVSLHMAYRDHAFDAFDTIFCAGPHHVEEARELERVNKLPAKKLVEHGYERLDRILETGSPTSKAPGSGPLHVLLAPSWGPDGLIETIGERLTRILLDSGCFVTVRPHPQTFRLAPASIAGLRDAHGSNPRFALDADAAGDASLRRADVMISDWSGAALDFAFGLEKPVLFIDGPRKVNNPNYEAIGREPFEVLIREQIGAVLPRDELAAAPDALRELVDRHEDGSIAGIRAASVFNVGQSAQAGASALARILSN